MSDLFTAPVPPDLSCAVNSHRGTTYDALKSIALRKWSWKREVERMSDGLLRARTNGERQPEQESAGRNIRHVRTLLNGTGWTVLDEAGHVCLCQESEVAAMLLELGSYPNPGHAGN